MKQLSLATVGFERQARTPRWAVFLCEMERVVPWSAPCALIEPDYPKPDYPKPGKGRPPIGVERMLRLYFWRQWFNLSDPAVEEAVYAWPAMRRLSGSISGASRCPTKRRHAACATGSRRTISAGGCSMRCRGIWPRTGSGSRPARLSMRSAREGSSRRRPRPRTPGRARSRDASNQERQPGVFRHEGAFGPRQPHQADPRGGGAAGQCRRQPARAHDAHARKKLPQRIVGSFIPCHKGLLSGSSRADGPRTVSWEPGENQQAYSVETDDER